MRPLLFPPCLRSLLYQCLPPPTPSHRTIHLWSSFRSKTMSPDAADFLPFHDYRPASKVFLNVALTDDGPFQRLSLETVLEKILKPGLVLVRLPRPRESNQDPPQSQEQPQEQEKEPSKRQEHTQEQPKARSQPQARSATRYAIRNASLVRRLGLSAPPFDFSASSKTKPKTLRFGIGTTPEYFLSALQTGMHRLREGYKLEVHIGTRIVSNTGTSGGDGEDGGDGANGDGTSAQGNAANAQKRRLRRLVDECVHLRPDVLLRSMPRKSGIVIQPQSDGRSVCWVVAPPFVRDGKDLEVPLDQTLAYYKKRERVLGKAAGAAAVGVAAGEGEGKWGMKMRKGRRRTPVGFLQKIVDGVMVTEEIYVDDKVGGTGAKATRRDGGTSGWEADALDDVYPLDEMAADGEQKSLSSDRSDVSESGADGNSDLHRG